jgi:hypothetical protein
MPAFEIGRFVEECFAAVDADEPADTIKDLLHQVVSTPDRLIDGLPDPLGQELVLFRDPRLTIIQVTRSRPRSAVKARRHSLPR